MIAYIGGTTHEVSRRGNLIGYRIAELYGPAAD